MIYNTQLRICFMVINRHDIFCSFSLLLVALLVLVNITQLSCVLYEVASDLPLTGHALYMNFPTPPPLPRA